MEKRIFSFDFLRCISVYLVILVHTSIYILSVKQINYADVEFWKVLIWGFYLSIGHYAVPFFFFISGYFLLRRQDKIKSFYVKKLPRIIAALIVWSCVYYALKDSIRFEYFPVGDIKYALYKPLMHHLWYLYAFISLLFVVPVLQRFVRFIAPKYIYLLLFVWWFGEMLIPFISSYYDNMNFEIPIHLKFAGYLLLGYYSQEWAKKFSWRGLAAIFLCSLILQSVFTAIMYFKNISSASIQIDYRLIGYFTPILPVGSVAVFIMVVKADYFVCVWGRLQKLIGVIADKSFMVYLMHMLPLTLLLNNQFISADYYLDHPTVAILFLSFLSFFISIICSIIISALKNFICMNIKFKAL